MHPGDSTNPDTPRQRRPRYRGTHPRRYDERYKELDAAAHPDIIAHVRSQGRTPAGMHVPVLLEAVLEALRLRPGNIVADCTLGYGGHAEAMIARIRPGGVLHGFDVDRDQLEQTRARLAGDGVKIVLHHGNFAGLAKAMREDSLDGFDAVLADLGVSSMQIDDPARGFSYKHDGPLDMRMDSRRRQCAADLVAKMSEAELSDALRDLADEPHCAEIAREIVAARQRGPITRTVQLVEIAEQAVRRMRRGEDDRQSAARTFQALRMLVNDELGALRALLRDAPHCLRPGGRLAIISFHSGEDRLVKQTFREGQRAGVYADISDGCVRADGTERRDNPRSSAAKLRWAVRAAEL